MVSGSLTSTVTTQTFSPPLPVTSAGTIFISFPTEAGPDISATPATAIGGGGGGGADNGFPSPTPDSGTDTGDSGSPSSDNSNPQSPGAGGSNPSPTSGTSSGNGQPGSQPQIGAVTTIVDGSRTFVSTVSENNSNGTRVLSPSNGSRGLVSVTTSTATGLSSTSTVTGLPNWSTRRSNIGHPKTTLALLVWIAAITAFKTF